MLPRIRQSAVALLLVTACASGGGGAPEAADASGEAASSSLRISVQNDHAAANTFVLFIEPATGVRQSLGTVEAGRNRTFTFAAAPGGQYVLIAQSSAGDSRSDRFTFNPPTSVTWDMSGQRLTVIRR